MASGFKQSQPLNRTTDNITRPTFVEQPSRNNTLNHYSSLSAQGMVIDQQRQRQKVTPVYTEERQVNRPVSWNQNQITENFSRSRKVKYSFKNPHDVSYTESRVEQRIEPVVEYKPVYVPERVVETQVRQIKTQSPVVIRRQTETIRQVNTHERELIVLRERVREQDVILSKIREITRMRKEECERQSKTVDFKCINTLVEIYNLSIAHTEFNRMAYLQTRINNFVPPAPQIRNITVPKPAPRVEVQQPAIHIRPQTHVRTNFITPEMTPKPSPRPSPIPERVYVPPQPQTQPQSIHIQREEIRRPAVVESEQIRKPFVVEREQFRKPVQIEREEIRRPFVIEREDIKKPVPAPVEREEVSKPVVPPAEYRDNSDKYIKEIYELRDQIISLELEIVKLKEKNKYLEISQETITTYREEIERLKRQITEFGNRDSQKDRESVEELERLKREIIQLKSNEREYETQLLESQNHIIYLEGLLNSKPEPEPVYQPAKESQDKYERQILVLKEKIYSYEKEIQQYYIFRDQIKVKEQEITSKESELVNMQQQLRSKDQIIISKQSQISTLRQDLRSKQQLLSSKQSQISTLRQDLRSKQQLLLSKQSVQKQTQPENNQEQLILSKETEIHNLKQEIIVLQEKNAEVLSFLEKAEDYIMQLQNQPQPEPVSQPEQGNALNIQLEQALEQQYKNQQQIKNQYDLQIVNMRKDFDIEITNINNHYEIQLQEFNQTIINLRQEITNLTTINVQLKQDITVYQTKIQQFNTTINNYEQTINQYKITINNHEQQAKTVSKGGVDQEAYDALWLDNGKRVIQVIFLMEEIDRLNVHYDEIRQHLLNAENHIRQTQEYISSLEMEIKTSAFSSSQANTYVIKIKQLENKIVNLTQELAHQRSKSSQHKTEIASLETRYQSIIQELDVKCLQIQSERDEALSKGGNSEQIRLWEEKYNQQTFELEELLNHLRNAEDYIKQNAEMWTKATEAYEILPEKLEIIQILKKDLEMTRTQNKQLNERIIQLEKLIQKMENRKSSSQVQTPAGVSDTRVTELEQSLSNYKRLYNEAQNKYAASVKEANTLKSQVQRLSSSHVSSSSRTTVTTTAQISEMEAKWAIERKNLEIEIDQLKNHLMGAESYIRELEEQLANLNNQYQIILTQHQTHRSDHSHIQQTLRQAGQQITQVRNAMPTQQSSSGARPTLG